MKKGVFVFMLLWLLISINFATSPKLPLFEYNYSGYLICDSTISKENFTIQLFGKNEYQEDYSALDGRRIDNEVSIFITDTTGKFYLSVNSDQKFDSLKVGLVLPVKPNIFSRAYSINENQYSEMIVHYTPESESGCSCTTEPTKTRIEKYRYSQSNIEFDISGLF